VWAALVLCRHWMAQGRPAGTQTLGMFEGWARTIGGVLEAAGVKGLLGNARELRAGRSDNWAEWGPFVAAWWEELGEKEVGVRELFDLATRRKMLDETLGDKGERSQRTRLGKQLARAVGRVFADLRVERSGKDKSGRQVYHLVQAEMPSGTGPPGP